MRKPPSMQELTEQVELWNSRHQVGTKVSVRKDDGTSEITTTTSEAYVMGGHSAVIFLAGISGCYRLDRVSAVAADYTAPASVEA